MEDGDSGDGSGGGGGGGGDDDGIGRRRWQWREGRKGEGGERNWREGEMTHLVWSGAKRGRE